MPRKSTISNPWVTFALCVLAVFITMPAAIAQRDDPDSRVYPPDSAPFGMTYGEWLAAEWQYALAIPASTNPALDSTGEYCGIGQSGGPVFFLVASFTPGVTRTCTVPSSQAILVGLIGAECSTVEPAPFHGTNAQELRSCVGPVVDGVGIHTLKLTVDGEPIHNLKSFRALSRTRQTRRLFAK